jgi:hypothetical protein
LILKIFSVVSLDGCPNLYNGSIVQVAWIEGKIFNTMREAEAHGLDLAKEWVDKRWGGL